MKDAISKDRIEKLHPKVRDTFRNFIEDCENNLDICLRITQGYRTIAQQDTLFAQGRTTPGKMVTNAKGGTSYHNYGLAIDMAVLVNDGKDIDWKYDMALLKPFARKYNIEWGGDWKTIKDFPHFQISFGLTWQRLFAMVQQKRTDAEGYVLLA